MNEYTVIIRCLCGCDCYAIHHIHAVTPQAAGEHMIEREQQHDRKVELCCVLKGHCEEA